MDNLWKSASNGKFGYSVQVNRQKCSLYKNWAALVLQSRKYILFIFYWIFSDYYFAAWTLGPKQEAMDPILQSYQMGTRRKQHLPVSFRYTTLFIGVFLLITFGACNLELNWFPNISTIYKIRRKWPMEFTYSLDAPKGHLPLTNCLRGTRLFETILEHPAFAKEAVSEGSNGAGKPDWLKWTT